MKAAAQLVFVPRALPVEPKEQMVVETTLFYMTMVTATATPADTTKPQTEANPSPTKSQQPLRSLLHSLEQLRNSPIVVSVNLCADNTIIVRPVTKDSVDPAKSHVTIEMESWWLSTFV